MKLVRVLFFILSCVSQFIVLSDVVGRFVDNMTLTLWIVSLFFLFVAFPFQEKKDAAIQRQNFSFPNFKIYLFAFLIIVLALTVRIILMQNIYAFHNDEYIGAYFSYSLGDLSKLDWFGVYPIPHDWIWQFPILYFFFQKVFFNIFGLSTLTMRLSIVPYIVIIFSFLFLIAKRFYTKEAALLAIAILAFFAPDLYLSRWSLHFISSAAFFLVATYFFVLSVEGGKKRHFALLGFFIGLCYMTYYSSYIAAPLLFFYALVLIIKKQIRLRMLKNFLLTIGIFIYTINPIAIYALKVDNFLINRVEQIKLINGSWSSYKDLKINSAQTFEVLKKQTVLSVESLYTDGIGGHGGYVFGNLALFDQITFLFILFSILYFLYKIVNKKDTNSLFLLTAIFVTFVAGMIFTTPPPAFHRISLIFPFICLLISVTITDIYMFIAKKQKKIALFLFTTLVLSALISNALHFKKILAKDGPDDPDYPQILQYLNQQNINMFYVAAFPSYGAGKILFIMSGGKINSVTQPLDELLETIPQGETSFLVILYPNEESIQKVKMKFANTVVTANYQKHALLRINRTFP